MIAVDTNLLVHAHRRDASLHAAARDAVASLVAEGRQWAVCYHSLIEFYGVVTRRKLWRVASPPEVALDQIAAWRESPAFHLLNDSPESLEWLNRLVLKARVEGSLIHDARIAACCLSHGVFELWTVDRDFSRFPELRTRNPL
jgi:toxin-antitoxin system PIN domain toxin